MVTFMSISISWLLASSTAEQPGATPPKSAAVVVTSERVALEPRHAIGLGHASRLGADGKVAVTGEESQEHVVVEVPGNLFERLSLQHWGSLFVGTVITPFSPDGRIDVETSRVTSNRFHGCLSPLLDHKACSALRGLDLRWQVFWLRGRRKAPRGVAYFRTGYTAGYAAFIDAERDVVGGTQPQRSLAYMTVPLFVGGNLYLLGDFPVRPFAGAGLGFDVLRLDYRGFQERPITDVSARFGFELHAGIQARITKYVWLSAEVQQLWSVRRKLDRLPDFSNEGFTIVTGIATNFPLGPRP